VKEGRNTQKKGKRRKPLLSQKEGEKKGLNRALWFRMKEAIKGKRTK